MLRLRGSRIARVVESASAGDSICRELHWDSEDSRRAGRDYLAVPRAGRAPRLKGRRPGKAHPELPFQPQVIAKLIICGKGMARCYRCNKPRLLHQSRTPWRLSSNPVTTSVPPGIRNRARSRFPSYRRFQSGPRASGTETHPPADKGSPCPRGCRMKSGGCWTVDRGRAGSRDDAATPGRAPARDAVAVVIASAASIARSPLRVQSLLNFASARRGGQTTGFSLHGMGVTSRPRRLIQTGRY